ncbi:MAG TPA: TetR/AcrR family transcriptional regulator, partial [Erysipelotrichaceae bacterium]|nr:TetR/AcrR family transcriptional regulator [Erysipelotrichaceae bacterium]
MVIRMKSKIIENKKIKENNLLQAAFNLFTKEDIINVSVNDIVKNAGVAKGTFYLYFKDKYQIRDILIQKEAHRLFEEAHKQLEKNDIRNFEDSVIFLINQVLIRLENNPLILKFVERNLSWGVFHAQLNTAIDNDSFSLIKEFNEIATVNGYEFENSEVILYLIVELTGST